MRSIARNRGGRAGELYRRIASEKNACVFACRSRARLISKRATKRRLVAKGRGQGSSLHDAGYKSRWRRLGLALLIIITEATMGWAEVVGKPATWLILVAAIACAAVIAIGVFIGSFPQNSVAYATSSIKCGGTIYECTTGNASGSCNMSGGTSGGTYTTVSCDDNKGNRSSASCSVGCSNSSGSGGCSIK